MKMDKLQTRSHAGLAVALRVSITRLSRRLRAQGGGSLSVTQLAALGAVERHGTMSPRELAQHEKMQPPSMTRVIAYLEENGLLTRSSHPTDGRQAVLTMTVAGRELLKEERRRKEAWLAQRLKELTPAEWATLRAAAPILEKLSQSD